MSILNRNDSQFYFNVVDGWGGNLEQGAVVSDSIVPSAQHVYIPSAPGSTSPLKMGAIVMSKHDGVQQTVQTPLVDADVNLDADKRAPNRFWMVVEGNTQYSYSARRFNKVVCMRGTFAVETAHVKGTLNVGDRVTPEHGTSGTVDAANPHTLVSGVPGINEGRLMAAASGDPVVGQVVDKKSIDGFTVYTIEMSI